VKRRIVIYAEGKLGPYASKTGNCVVRYFPDEVVGVIDSAKKGKPLEELIGIGGGIPVLASLEESLPFHPDTFLVGSAPVGGVLNSALLGVVKEALRNRMHVVSGLHDFFSDMPEIAKLAEKNGVQLNDLRKIQAPPHVARSGWKKVKARVVLSVGADCNSGKLSTIYEVYRSFRKRNIAAEFIGTGQTGIFLAGRGIPADAVVSDFLPGAVEEEIAISDARGAEVIFVEGQGALTHPVYSGVTMGLLHGAMPDAMIFCLDPTRERTDWGDKIPPIGKMIDFHEFALSFFKKSRVAGVGVITRNLVADAEAQEAIRDIASLTGLPANDPYRFGCENLAEALWQYLRR